MIRKQPLIEETEATKVETINMLSNIEHYVGEKEPRLAPLLISLVLSSIPALIYSYYFMGIIPLKIFIPIYIYYIVRVFMKVLGEEKKKITQFKKQLYNVYSSALDLLNISYIHDDGCIEYNNNVISYIIVLENGQINDPIQRAQSIRKLIDFLTFKFNLDIYITNASLRQALIERYKTANKFKDKQISSDFIEMIDYLLEISSKKSLLQTVKFVVRVPKYDWDKCKRTIESLLISNDVKAFRAMHLAKKSEVEEIISRDIDAYIDFDKMNIDKYANHKYGKSKVITYNKKELKEEEEFLVTDFMIHDNKG